ncbi:MAG: hypothetical protein V4591_10890 [Bdellovibrionota bacterium]
MKNYLLFSVVPFLATTNLYAKNNIFFNYSDMSVNSVGIFNPKVEEGKNGLNAELIARKNGIDNLAKYFESSCEGLDKSSLTVKNDWENKFRSQGTEIFSNGVLAVTLQAPMKQVFKTASNTKKSIKTDDGEKIAFQTSEQIPLAAIRCGSLELNLGNNKKIHVIPMDSIKAPSTTTKIIHMVFNAKTLDLDLDPAFKEKNNDIIENSTLADIEDVSTDVIPVSFAINSVDDSEE